jgi:hypothetical protein
MTGHDELAMKFLPCREDSTRFIALRLRKGGVRLVARPGECSGQAFAAVHRDFTFGWLNDARSEKELLR